MQDVAVKNLGLFEFQQLRSFGDRINKYGVNFAVCDAEGEPVLLCEADVFKSEKQRLTEAAVDVLKRGCSEAVEVYQQGEYGRILYVVLRHLGGDDESGGAAGAALIDLGDESSNIKRKGTSAGYSGMPVGVRDMVLSEMLGLLAETFRAASKNEKQIDMVSMELSHTYEELVLLHKLSTSMKVTESDANFLQMACDSLTDIVSVEGIAVLLERAVDGEKRLILAAGSGLIDIDEYMTAVLHSRLLMEIENDKEALLDSEVDSPLRYEWPANIKNIIAVPLYGKGKSGHQLTEGTQTGNCLIGLMVAINRIDKPDFDSTDAKLFNSVANGCAVFVENTRLFNDLKELFIGSLKALTSSIDAKDQYTRGHSERVAFISRWIAERFSGQRQMEQEQIHKIYLAGLLHDIGKVGINEEVLRKDGRLTKQEFDHIRKHPLVGASILGGIKQMSDIVPGVLCHHERVDGQGYPNGLAGEQIPLIGKIIGLADSFDAMTSKRTYRGAMTIGQALNEIKKGTGTQFDEETARVFLESDVYRLWDIMQDGFGELYGESDFSEYGAAAVGSIIR